MKLAIIGSTTFTDYKLLCKTLEPYKDKVTLVVSGAAKGADTLGAKWSREVLKKEPLEFPADWENLEVEPCRVKTRSDGTKYNVLAGFNRNTIIVENADVVIAFWDGRSKGTRDSLYKCDKAGKPKKIIRYLKEDTIENTNRFFKI